MSASAVTLPPDSSVRTNGFAFTSTSTTVSAAISVPKRSACLRVTSMSSGPWMPCGKPGKFSTSVVVVSCPPGWMPSRTRGARFAREA
jgi:hypothetical protein